MESQSLVLAVLGVAVGPFIVCVFLVMILASSGQSLGLRKLSLKILVKIFEYVAKKIRDEDLSVGVDASREPVIDRSDASNDPTHGLQTFPPPPTIVEPTGETPKFFFPDDDEDEEEKAEATSGGLSSSTPSSPLTGTKFRHVRNLSAHEVGAPASLQAGDSLGVSTPGSAHIIARELYNPSEFAETVLSEWHQQKPEGKLPRIKSLGTLRREFHLSDVMSFAKAGVEAIIEDQVTSRFRAEELTTWNLLTRTNQNYQYRSKRLYTLWAVGFFFRYFVLFPFRLTLAIFGIGLLICVTFVIGYLPPGRLKQILNRHFSLMCYRILSRSISAIITYHNRENMARPGGICVANHTTPIDVVVLSCDNSYAMVGQRHGGFLGVFQRALHRATDHIWFERSEANDRLAVSRRLREHVEDPQKLPILIFPEGTCINNTSVMMFKKGSFEVGGRIHPVAIKYHPEFGDAFWNSSEQSMITYIIMMMTSWAIVVDVWYLPEMVQRPNEDAIAFANRVKREICRQGGLVDLDWDGMLKRQQPKASLLQQAQEEISRTFSCGRGNESGDALSPNSGEGGADGEARLRRARD